MMARRVTVPGVVILIAGLAGGILLYRTTSRSISLVSHAEDLPPFMAMPAVTNSLRRFDLAFRTSAKQMSLKGAFMVSGTHDATYLLRYQKRGYVFSPSEGLELFFNANDQLVGIRYTASGGSRFAANEKWVRH